MRFSAPVFVIALLEAIMWNSPSLCLAGQMHLNQLLSTHNEILKFAAPQNAMVPLAPTPSGSSADAYSLSALHRIRELELYRRALKEDLCENAASKAMSTLSQQMSVIARRPSSWSAQQHLILRAGSRSPVESSPATGEDGERATSDGTPSTSSPQVMALLGAVIYAVASAYGGDYSGTRGIKRRREASSPSPSEDSVAVEESPVPFDLSPPVFDESGAQSPASSVASAMSPASCASPALLLGPQEPTFQQSKRQRRAESLSFTESVPCSLPAELCAAFEEEKKSYVAIASPKPDESEAESEALELEQRVAWPIERDQECEVAAPEAQRFRPAEEGQPELAALFESALDQVSGFKQQMDSVCLYEDPFFLC